MEMSGSAAAAPRPVTQVVDVELWLNRAKDPSPVRAFTPATEAYVPKHRKELIAS
jgi:hypothetical protein